MQNWKIFILSILLLFTGNISRGITPSQDELESMVKASFIHKFAKYTSWPTEESDENFVIGVYNSEKITSRYQQAFKTRKIKGLPVQVHTVKSESKACDCHILFVPHNYRQKIGLITQQYNNSETLIIAESKGMSKKGAHINFIKTYNETLHFEINESQVKKSGLKMNMLLLDIAILIED